MRSHSMPRASPNSRRGPERQDSWANVSRSRMQGCNGVVRPKPSGLVASPSWARPFVVAGGSTCALNRALVQAGIEAKSARSVSSLLVRTAGDGGCSAPAATRGGRRPLFCGGEPRTSEASDGSLAQSDGLRGLEPADVISTMFIAARGRKVSGPTIFAENAPNHITVRQLFYQAEARVRFLR